MEMTELLDAVRRRWTAEGVAPATPASAGDVAAFETRYGVRLPGDVRAYLLALNGAEDGKLGAMDDRFLSFWNLAELRPLPEEAPGFANFPGAASCFAFADHLAWSHAYALRLSGDENASAPVSVLYGPGAVIETAPSFRAFLEAYLAGDETVLFPDSGPVVRERRLVAELATAAREEAPRLKNRARLGRELTRFARAWARAHPSTASEAVVVVRMRVDREGAPHDISVDQGSGNVELDAEALRAAERMRFTPARVDGTPVWVWITIPITFRFHPARPPGTTFVRLLRTFGRICRA
ncbi:MAG TPA: TonB family protein [Longimicrobiaceae bacterium]